MRPWPVLLLVGVAASASPREDELLASLATQERFDRDEAARRAAAWRAYERAHANDTIAPNFATRPYRLGDLVWCEWPLLVASTPVLFPSSIGSAYVRERTRRAEQQAVALELLESQLKEHLAERAAALARAEEQLRERDDAARRQQLAAEEAARQIAERDATIASLEGRARAAEADAASRRTQLQRTAALGAQLHGIQELKPAQCT